MLPICLYLFQSHFFFVEHDVITIVIIAIVYNLKICLNIICYPFLLLILPSTIIAIVLILKEIDNLFSLVLLRDMNQAGS